MKVLNHVKIMLAIMMLFIAGRVMAEGQMVNSILPPDHLLENLPWLGEDGKIESKGLFDFEDFRGVGPKDVISIYRQSAPVAELDKPHNQTLAVCFFDTPTQKYLKALEDEGGPIQWVKLMKEDGWRSPILVVLRDDLKGHRVLRGYTCEKNQMKRVLDAQSTQAFVQFTTGLQSGKILVSAQSMPKDSGSAEHVFTWDTTKNAFVEASYKSIAGWEGDSILLPTPTAVPMQVAQAGKPAAPQIAPDGWWEVPFDVNKSYLKLKTEMVPALIQKNQMAPLGQKANAFFKEAQKSGMAGKGFAAMRSGYYTAVAEALLNTNRAKDAAYYLKIALSYQADNAEALALKAKLPQ